MSISGRQAGRYPRQEYSSDECYIQQMSRKHSTESFSSSIEMLLCATAESRVLKLRSIEFFHIMVSAISENREMTIEYAFIYKSNLYFVYL